MNLTLHLSPNKRKTDGEVEEEKLKDINVTQNKSDLYQGFVFKHVEDELRS